MRLIIAGSRWVPVEEAYQMVCEAIGVSTAYFNNAQISQIVSGNNGGIDIAGEEWAKRRGITCKLFPADWGAHGKAAGPIRNGLMAVYADALLAIWDGMSGGTSDMIHKMNGRRKPVYVHMVKRDK